MTRYNTLLDMLNKFSKNNFLKIHIQSTRIADVRSYVLWQSILNLLQEAKDKSIDEKEKVIITRSYNLFYKCESTWKIEQITHKKIKLSVSKVYSGIVVFFLKFFLKKKLQKKTDLETQNLILESI